MNPYFSLIAQIFGWPALTTDIVDPSYYFSTIKSGCPASGPISCGTRNVSDTCCTESPGGLLLQTQFWDTDVPGSPGDSWTIHGLWPDNCDGTYVENCDRSRAHYNIPETLDYMHKFWLNDGGSNEHLWNHEWSTHGTCYSTLKPSCLPDKSPEGAEAVAYFENVVELFQTLPTYKWLADADITPSEHRKYSLDEIISALEDGSGYTPAVGCSRGELNTISWYFHLQGSLLDGKFIPIDSPKDSTCPDKNIKYLPKEDSD